jgi:hypothetical protein
MKKGPREEILYVSAVSLIRLPRVVEVEVG